MDDGEELGLGKVEAIQKPLQRRGPYWQGIACGQQDV